MALVLTVRQTMDCLLRRVCPLFIYEGARSEVETPPHVGSAVYFRYNSFSGLITAKHVVEAAQGKLLTMRTPNPHEAAATFTTLPYSINPIGVHHPLLQHEDICIIPLEM